MKITNNLLIPLMTILPGGSILAIGGLGLHLGQDQISVSSTTDSRTDPTGLTEVRIIRDGFQNPTNLGGYLYLDVIPFIDLEAEIQVVKADYKFNFQNETSGNTIESGKKGFTWGSVSAYLTARKKLFGLGLPLLGGIKLHAGGGVNFHKAAPFISFDLIEELQEGESKDLFDSFDEKEMAGNIVSYMDNNIATQTGFHLQTGVQIKLISFDLFVNYRYTIVDLYPDTEGFSSLNLMLGMGI